MTSATVISFGIFTVIMVFAPQIVSVFTNDPELIDLTTPALRAVFLATPLLAINLLGSAYFQAIGRARPALILSLSKQGFILIPLIFILPYFFGIYGIWFSFPIADTGAALITAIFFKYVRNKEINSAQPELSDTHNESESEKAAPAE
jgi:Na+-driven multidrug efflux pump